MDWNEIENEYQTAPEAESSFIEIPDGRFNVRVDQVDLKETKTTGVPMLSLVLRITNSGKYYDKPLFKNIVFSPSALPYAKADMGILGWKYKLSDLEDISKRSELLDINLEVNKRTKGKNDKGQDNIIVYFNKNLGSLNNHKPQNLQTSLTNKSMTGSLLDDELPF